MKKFKEDMVQHSPEGHRGNVCISEMREEEPLVPAAGEERFGKTISLTRKGCFGIQSCLKHGENFYV